VNVTVVPEDDAAPEIEEGASQECVGAHLRKHRKCCVDIFAAAGGHYVDLQPKR
jgi:hypothetical protein